MFRPYNNKKKWEERGMYYAMEITRVYTFENYKKRDDFIKERPMSRMMVCPECARKVLSRRKENAFLREYEIERTGKVHESVNR